MILIMPNYDFWWNQRFMRRISLDKKDILTLIISGYGALLSTVVLAWNVINARKDRGSIKFVGFRAQTIQEGRPVKEAIYFEFVNSGKRPVLLTGIGGKFKRKSTGKGPYFVITTSSSIPKKLEPSDRHQEIFYDLSIIDSNIKSLYAFDSLNNKYKMKSKILKSLIRDNLKYSQAQY